MRKTGRRTLAAVAAGALGAGLLIGLGATPANAAVTSGGVVAPTTASSNYFITAGNPATAITVIAGRTVTVDLSFLSSNAAAQNVTMTINTAAAPGTPVTTLTRVSGATLAQTDDSTVTFNDPNAAVTSTGRVSFTAPAAGTAGWRLTLVGAGGGQTTPVAITSVAAGTVTSVTPPAASRAGGSTLGAQTVAFTGTNFNATAGVEYNVCMISGPTGTPVWTPGADVAGDAGAAIVSATAATLNFGNGSLPGAYSLGLYSRGTGIAGDVCGGTNGVALADAQLVNTFNVNFGGDIASVTQTPASASLVPAATQTMTVTALDSAGRRTLATVGDNITPVSSAPATATAGALGMAAATGAMTYTVTAVAPGSSVVTAAPQNLSVTGPTSLISVIATGATTTTTQISLNQPNVANLTEDPLGAVPWDMRYDANTTVTSFTYRVTGLQAGQTYRWTAASTGGTIRLNSGVAAAAASGTLTATSAGDDTVVLTSTGQTAGNTITFTVVGNGVAGAAAGADKRNIVTFAAGVAAFQTPVNNGTYYATASTATPIAILVEDQYGEAFGGAAVAITPQGSTTPVATGTTNNAGAVTLNVTAPATGQTVYNLTGTTSTGTVITAVQFTVTVTAPTVTFAAGVTTPTNTVGIFTPLPVVGAGQFTPVTVNVRNAGVPVTGAAVTFTGTPGVRFLSAAPGPQTLWNSGTATPTPVFTAAGQATIWAYSTTTGTATVTATVAGVSANGNFDVSTAANDARNIAITSPAEIEAGKVGIVNVTLTDVYGNVVPNANAVTLTMDDTSVGFFANGLRQIQLTPGPNGVIQATVTSGVTESGRMSIQVAQPGAGNQFGALAGRQTSNSAGNDAPGWAASNAPQTVSIEVKPSAASRSISIAGARTTVSGKPGIEVIGVTTGIENGKTVIPFFRFPGQTSFTEGSARPVITDGGFEWMRKTGKKFYAYVTSDDGLVKSNRVIIPAN